MIRFSRFAQVASALAAAALLAACSGGADQTPAPDTPKAIVLGFSQIGAESEWRTANTTSVQSAAKDGRGAVRVSQPADPYAGQASWKRQSGGIRAFH